MERAPAKTLLLAMLDRIVTAGAHAQLADVAHHDCLWRVFHPFNDLPSTAALIERFADPLVAAFPDLEHRPACLIAGRYEGRTQVSSWGVLLGTFDAPLLGIPATHGMATLRIGINATITDGRFSRVHILLDLVDLMRQAGVYPFRRMPGSPEQWPFPPADEAEGAAAMAEGDRTMAIVHAMQMGLPKPEDIAAGLNDGKNRHSEHWHEHMNWFGPAGIGSARGQRGFRDVHGSLFLQAFPDRAGFPRPDGADEDAPGHYIRLGDGRFAVTGGWPSLAGTHLGSEWLGLPPSGRRIEMRVADWYRLDDRRRIVDNWVMMDVPHIVAQMGLDIFHDLQFAVDPARPRWPKTA